MMFRGPLLGSSWQATWIACAWSTWSPSATGEGGREAGKGRSGKVLQVLLKGFNNLKELESDGRRKQGKETQEITQFDAEFLKIQVVDLSPQPLVNQTY